VFLHLDAGLLATAVVLVAADRVPTFKVEAHCRDVASRAAPVGEVEICVRKEWAARDRLVKEWSRFVRADKSHCLELSKGEPTYTGLLTCLELAQEARKIREKERSTTGRGRR
jgi:hypothetical protein